ncbi:hypothetical protein JCM17846_16300 [Iodidimonas nitroreducens]|uniref:Peptidase S49 domain-containing protein n=1 Tax=Iodidimonas nitroreducens TaxID=1236968 RepID=A0A5A7N768_9PROT|nr:S49 family peptidase [Iodidimonas nitroreducens]GER03948.1 hypothetical protein JCM17846_16300 [Iodidimonas nitroreducens]
MVTLRGTIIPGEAPVGDIGSESALKLIHEARTNDRVKALVLRVDSPGGSAFASELIRQAVLEVKAAGKPVVASFGSVAASGGYWISANADQIWRCRKPLPVPLAYSVWWQPLKSRWRHWGCIAMVWALRNWPELLT